MLMLIPYLLAGLSLISPVATIVPDRKYTSPDDHMVTVLHDVFGTTFHELKGSFLGMEFTARECRYDGVGVTYEKDWETVFPAREVGEPDSVLPPKLGKVDGLAILVYHMKCGGEDKDVQWVGDHLPILNDRYDLVRMYDLTKMDKIPEAKRPGWLTQVIPLANKHLEEQGRSLRFENPAFVANGDMDNIPLIGSNGLKREVR